MTVTDNCFSTVAGATLSLPERGVSGLDSARVRNEAITSLKKLDGVFLPPNLRTLDRTASFEAFPATGTTWFRSRQSMEKVVLVAEPGCGKTALLNWLASSRDNWFGAVPVLMLDAVTWRTQAAQDMLEEWQTEAAANRSAAQGTMGWLLIDALGEIKDAGERESLTREMTAWADQNQGLGCVIALRSYDWDWARAFLGEFMPLEIVPLTPAKAGELVEMWLQALGYKKSNAEKESAVFRQELWRRPNIRLFLEQPFFIKKALELWLENEPLPASRNGLLRDHFRLRFKGQYTHGQSRGFAIMGGEQDHFEFLGELGWMIMDSPYGAVDTASANSLWVGFCRRRLWEGMEEEGPIFLQQLVEAGYLENNASGDWRFPERAIAEWLGISHLVRSYQEEDRGTFAGLCQKLMGSRSNDPTRLHWLESLCGWLDGVRAEVLLRPLANKHIQTLSPGMLMAAARCLGEVRSRGACSDFDADFRTMLEELVFYSPQERNLVLPGVSNTEHEVNLWQPQRIREEAVRMRAGLWLARSDTPGWLESILNNPQTDVLARISAMDSILRLYPQLAESKDLLRDKMQNDSDPLVRRAALQLLVGTQTEAPEVVAVVLKEQITMEPIPQVRGTALRELAMAFRKPETLQFIANAGGTDSSPVVRRSAFESAIDFFMEYPETVEFVASRAMLDTDYLIRRDTMAQLKARFGNHPVTMSTFFDRAGNDPSYAIRSYAISYLTKVAKTDTRYRELLITRSADEPVNVMRKHLLTALAREHGSDVMPHLLQRYTAEPDLYVRLHLKEILRAMRSYRS